MPRTKKGTPPSYRQHTSGQAVVTVRTTSGNRRDILLGQWDTDESKAEYTRVLGVLSAHGGRYPEATTQPISPSVNEVILAFWKHAEFHYGEGSKELKQYRYSLRPLREMYGEHPADKFTPKCLKAVRQGMADRGWRRTVINRRLTRIKTMFSWAVSEELVPPSISHGLREGKGFRKGEKCVRESEPVQPAFAEDMLAALPHCPVSRVARECRCTRGSACPNGNRANLFRSSTRRLDYLIRESPTARCCRIRVTSSGVEVVLPLGSEE